MTTRSPGVKGAPIAPPISITDLQSSSRFLAAVVESSEDAIITKDLNGIITTWNGAAQRMFGYTAEEVVGQPITILMPEDRVGEEPGILARIRAGERVEHFETIRRHKDGRLINISLTVSPVRDEAGIIIGASKIARDITELIKTRSELARAHAQLSRSHAELDRLVHERTASLERALSQMGEFTHTVSHDLRAPARAVKGFAIAALEDYGPAVPEGLRDYLNRIAASGDRMEGLIRDLLEYTKVSREGGEPQPVSLDALLTSIVSEHEDLRPPKAQLEVRQPLATVIANETLLWQALANLLANAVKFVPTGTVPRVQVWTERRDQSVRLWVKDNGIGIHPKYHQRIFGMFERLHHGEYEGAGIGLAIVRKSAENMGGKVGVVSDGNSGSSFWIELPAPKE